MKFMSVILLVFAAVIANAQTPLKDSNKLFQNAPAVKNVRVTILSDSVASRRTRAEWGFSAFVEIDLGTRKRYILFDTGDKPDTVIFNSLAAKDKETPRVNFAAFKNNEIDIIISHHHSDHTTGLWSLLEEYPKAFGKIHIGPEAFNPRYKCNKYDRPTGGDRKCLDVEMSKQTNVLLETGLLFKQKYGDQRFKETFVVHSRFSEVWEDVAGVWMTGSIPRETGEDYTFGTTNNTVIMRGHAYVHDILPEENALVVKTGEGLLVLSGCGHAGIINTLRHIEDVTGERRIATLIGGLHLLAHDPKGFKWTANELNQYRIKTFVGSHCTGIERMIALRDILGMTALNAPFGTVETIFDTSKGVVLPSPNINGPL